MSVSNGEKANETTFNSSFISTETDSQTIAKIDLNRTGSGAQIPDAQQKINDNETDIATNRADIDSNDVELADHETRISTNETDISTIQTSLTTDTMDLSTNQTAAGEKTFSNNVTINADLSVTGTIASVNDLEVDDNIITVNKNGTDATSEGAGIDVERVGTNGSIAYEDALSGGNKFKVGALGSEKEISTVVHDTEANIFLTGTPLTGVRYHATDTGKNWYYNEITLQFEQGGGGEGGGGLDVFSTQQFEDTGFTVNSSGNNAAFLGGGTLDGVISFETASPIAGDQSLKYTTTTDSTDDYVEVEVIDLELKQRGQDIKVRLMADTLNFPENITIVCYDKTNSAVLSSSLDLIESSTARTFYEFSFYVPDTCAQISWGFQISGNAGATTNFIMDEVEWSTNPFVSSDVIETQSLEYTEDLSVYQDRTAGEHRFSTGLTTSDFNGSSILKVEDDSGNTRTKFTAIRECQVVLSYSLRIANVGSRARLYKNGTLIEEGSSVASAGDYSTSTTSVNLSSGDYVTVGSGTGGGEVSGAAYLNITATATSEHIITPAKSNMSDWESYAPTTQGFGTITAVETEWRQVGKNVELRGGFTLGTVSAVEAQIGLPSGFTVENKASSDTHACGYLRIDTGSTTGEISVMCTDGDSFVNLSGSQSGTFSPLEPRLATNFFSSSQRVSFEISLPVAELSSDAQFLAAVPIQRTCYIKEVQNSGVDGGTFTSGAWQTRTLNNVSGASEIVSLAANQFTLGAGQYDFDISANAYRVNNHQAKLVSNPSGSAIDEIIGSTEFSGAGDSISTDSKIKGRLELTSATAFEIQHRCQTTLAAQGWGNSCGFGVDEIYTTVKITKLR